MYHDNKDMDTEIKKAVEMLRYCHKERIFGFEYDDAKFTIAYAIGRDGFCLVRQEDAEKIGIDFY